MLATGTSTTPEEDLLLTNHLLLVRNICRLALPIIIQI